MEVTNKLIGYVERNGLAPARPASTDAADGPACGKCGTTDSVARLTYTDLKTGKWSVIDRCEACLETGLRASKPEAADELMRFMKRFAYPSA